MMILAIIGTILLLAMVTIGIAKYGIKSCLSDYYYSIGKWFTAAMCTSAVALMVAYIDAMPESFQVLSFFCCAGIAFVGAAPCYKSGGIDKKVHSGAAIISAGCGIALMLCLHIYTPLIIATFAVIALIVYRRHAWLLWLEFACFASVIATLFMLLI